MINGLKGQLRYAENERDDAKGELKVCKDRYGNMDCPAGQLEALLLVMLK